MKLLIQHYFDAAHQLPDTPYLVTKACARLHGHTYAVKVEIESEELKGGMVVDFKAVKSLIDVLDHEYINEVFERLEVKDEPSAENIAKFIANQIKDKLGFSSTIHICEGYKGHERASWAIYSNIKK